MFGKLLRSFMKPKATIALNPLPAMHFAYLVGNVPPIQVYVRKEYVTQFEEGHGELEQGVWVSVKSKKDRAFLFETLFCEYGALYDKLPISAFLWKKEVDFDSLLPLDYLQLWNCFSYEFTVVNKVNVAELRVEVLMKNGKWYPGKYMFTIDHCKSDPGELNTVWSEIPSEHKSFNIIQLDNGQFCAQPNNRLKWKQSSIIPVQTKSAKFFKVCEIDYQVEDTPKWSVADTVGFFYKENSEKKVFDPNDPQESVDSNKTEEKKQPIEPSKPVPQATATIATTTTTTTTNSTEKHPNRVRKMGAEVVNHIGGTSKPY